MNEVALVTGGTDGVGSSMVKALYKKGYEVHYLGTNQKKGEALKIELSNGPGTLRFWKVDLYHLSEISSFLEQFLAEVSGISRLIFSAGILLPKREETSGGIEKTFAINYLSAYYLSRELEPVLDKNSRVFFVSGGGPLVLKTRLDFSNLQLKKNYNPARAAANAVHAKTVLAQILAEEWKDNKISVNAFHPGIVRSGLGRNLPFPLDRVTRIAALLMPKETRIGINLALSEDYEGESGYFYEGKKKKQLSFDDKYCQLLRMKSEELIGTHS
jgi:NAD(P)-dependent dehydrogenase (short-subunit alcohol dehydrogenase family)